MLMDLRISFNPMHSSDVILLSSDPTNNNIDITKEHVDYFPMTTSNIP